MKHRYLFGLLLGVVCFCLYLFQVIYAGVKEKTIADLNSRQLIHARQAGRGIEYFFSDLITFLTKISESGHIIELDDQGKKEMDFALKTDRQEIKAITRVDETGRILYTLPYDGTAIGKDISYQKHIRKIMNTRKPVVSDVFTAVRGYNAVALHVPVFKGNEYRGTLGVLIDFQAISKKFLEDIRIGETGYAWMISRDGIELYCPVPGHTGKSVFENWKDFPSVISVAKEMVKGSPGDATYTFDQIRDRKTETVRKHAVYLPVKIGDTFWTIIVASSEDELLASLESFRNKLIFVIGLLFLGSAVFSFYGMRARGIVREEAKRQKTEKELRESEERYRDLVENATDLICTHDLKGTLLSVNAAAAKAGGFAPEEVVGLCIPDMLPQARRNEFDDYIKAIQRDKTAAGIMKIVTQAGEVRFWEYRNTLRTEGVPAPVARSMARDVTGEVLAKLALRKSEKRYRNILENIEDGYFEVDTAGNFTFFNVSTCRIIGYSENELMGRNNREFTDDENAKKIFKVFNEVYRTGIPTKAFDWELIRKDGSKCFVEMVVSLITDSNNVKTGFRGIVRDVTERKRSAEELDNSFKRLRAALGATIQAVAITVETRDPYTAGHQKRVADLSRAIATEMGLDINRTDGIRMAGVIHDLGKMAIPAEILSKPSRLSEIEYKLIKIHPRAGYDILKDVEFPWPIAQIVLQHHERLNGSGYPAGLKGEEILMEARIIAVADVVEAISSFRPYRPAQGMEKALGEIIQNKGILYDPAVVDACLCLFRDRGYKFV